MKTIKIIDVKSNESLYRVACAMGELTIMRKIGLEHGAKEPKPIEQSMNAIMDVLVYKFQKVFMDEFPKYAGNRMALGEDGDGIKVKVYDELLEDYDGECEHDECDDDSEYDDSDDSVDLESILKDSGLESADEHVERLADDIKNRRGGLA